MQGVQPPPPLDPIFFLGGGGVWGVNPVTPFGSEDFFLFIYLFIYFYFLFYLFIFSFFFLFYGGGGGLACLSERLLMYEGYTPTPCLENDQKFKDGKKLFSLCLL